MLFCADEKEEVRHLPPIVPVVFYQGETRWQHATEFSELFTGPAAALAAGERILHRPPRRAGSLTCGVRTW